MSVKSPKILNYGSLNLDHVYAVAEFVRAGETIPTTAYQVYPGGKGANQSVALARAGATVHHAGAVGKDGSWMVELLRNEGVNTAGIKTLDTPTGHAVIQVNATGENAIFLYGGANRALSEPAMAAVLDTFNPGDWLLLQNEINGIPFLIEAAASRKLKICFNPAPMDSSIADYPLDRVSLLILNRSEGYALSGKSEPAEILPVLRERYSVPEWVLTLGEEGLVLFHDETTTDIEAVKVKPVDTTAAGDTFVGYYLAGRSAGQEPAAAAKRAAQAAAIAVTREGAIPSIPRPAEIKV